MMTERECWWSRNYNKYLQVAFICELKRSYRNPAASAKGSQYNKIIITVYFVNVCMNTILTFCMYIYSLAAYEIFKFKLESLSNYCRYTYNVGWKDHH